MAVSNRPGVSDEALTEFRREFGDKHNFNQPGAMWEAFLEIFNKGFEAGWDEGYSDGYRDGANHA